MKIAIIGCGGHARSVADVLNDNGNMSIIFFDHMAKVDETIMGGVCCMPP